MGVDMEKEKGREKAREKHEKFASVKVERENLQKIVFEQTLQRFKHTLGDPEAGTLCEDQDILDHCAEPERYSQNYSTLNRALWTQIGFCKQRRVFFSLYELRLRKARKIEWK